MEKKRAVCPHDCPDTCSLQVTIKKGRVIAIGGDPDHPITDGVVCSKVRHYPERLYGNGRIKRPLKRRGRKGEGDFTPISWEEALTTITSRIKGIVEEYGKESILPCSYAGTMGIINNASMDRRFFHRLGASRLERTICSSAGNAGYMKTMGANRGLDPRETLLSKVIIFWGSNAISTNIHQWILALKARKKGATIIVIDVHKNKTARQGDLFYQVRPGTDGALALGMIHLLIKRDKLDRDFLDSYTTGFSLLKKRVEAFTPERVSSITSLSVEEIEELTHLYASTKESFIRIGNGLQHHYNGGEAVRNISLLPSLTGAWKVKGGGAMKGNSLASFNTHLLERPDLSPQEVRTINLIQLGEALTTLRPPVKLLWVYNCNPAAVVPSLGKVLSGLQREDLFTVVHEQVMTDTVLYGDIILPATTMLEHLDIYRSYWHTFLQVSKPLIPPVGESRSNLEVFREMAERMGFKDPCFQDDAETIIEEALDVLKNHNQGITWERLKEEGWIDLNPEERKPIFDDEYRVPTESGRIELASPTDPRFTPLKRDTTYPLQLINPPNHGFLNTTFSQLFKIQELEKNPILEIHPQDALSRSIEDDSLVRVFNDRGEVMIRAKIEETVKEGTLISLGIWPNSFYGHQGNLNLLACDDLADMGQGAVFFSTFVEVEPL